MSRRGKQIFKKPERKLFVGEWLARLGRKPTELAKAVGVTESYVSELISHKKDNPSPVLLLEVSEWLGLTVNDLYRSPPPAAAVSAIERMDPSQMAALGRLLDELKPGKRK